MNKKLIAVASLLVLTSFISVIQIARAVSLPGGEALFETSLQDRISSSDISMTLVANSLKGGGTISGYHCFTVDEGRTDQEFICGSVSGTSVTSLERGVSLVDGVTTITSLKIQHRKGANVKISDYPLIQRLRNVLNGGASIPNLIAYLVGTGCSGASPSNSICDKSYIDDVVVSGAPNANDTTKGIVETATGAEAAAGTSLGSTGARLVLGANIATSNCQSAANSVLVASSTTGKLDGRCLDTTSNSHSWAKVQTFAGGSLTTASSTRTATTSIAASSVTNNALILNGVPYQYPSSQGAANTQLQNDGTGVVSWVPTVRSYTRASTTASTVFANNTVTSLPINIPANTLSASSTIEVIGHTSCTDNGSGGTCNLRIIDTNGTTYFDHPITPGTSRACAMNFVLKINAVSLTSQTTVMSAACQGNASTPDQFDIQGAAGNWALAAGFKVQYSTSNSSGATGSTDGFVMIITP